jgi:hypothetical protein
VVVIAADASQREEALTTGASFAIAPEEEARELPILLRDHARMMERDLIDQLDDQCNQPLPPDAVRALHKFNAGEYYKQHDLFEVLWMKEPGPIRNLYQAILQVGIAYYQITRSNRQGALKMLQRAQQWLARLPDTCQGVDVARLRADADRVLDALTRMSDDQMDTFDRGLLAPVRMVGE